MWPLWASCRKLLVLVDVTDGGFLALLCIRKRRLLLAHGFLSRNLLAGAFLPEVFISCCNFSFISSVGNNRSTLHSRCFLGGSFWESHCLELFTCILDDTVPRFLCLCDFKMVHVCHLSFSFSDFSFLDPSVTVHLASILCAARLAGHRPVDIICFL